MAAERGLIYALSGFQRVRWQPVLEKRLDHYISSVCRDDDDGSIEWEFSRKRQIGLGL